MRHSGFVLSRRTSAFAFFSVLLGLARPAPAAGQEVTAVISPSPGPYSAAFDGFVKAFGSDVPAIRLPSRRSVGERTKVVVAFGGEAAVGAYPERAAVIACLAPGIATHSRHGGAMAVVAMRPAPAALLARLRGLQPGLKRLAVLWSARVMSGYVAELERAGAALGVDIVAVRADGPAQVPDALRALAGKADALWLAPDPDIVTPQTFQTIKQFSWDNSVPFYAPMAGLAAAGASAAVSIDAEETGAQAAALARRALAGETLPEIVYPVRTELTVNLPSAQKAGLSPGPEALATADKVIR